MMGEDGERQVQEIAHAERPRARKMLRNHQLNLFLIIKHSLEPIATEFHTTVNMLDKSLEKDPLTLARWVYLLRVIQIRPECQNHSIQLIVVILKHIARKSVAPKSHHSM